jgi:hypothetical protein
MRFLSEMPFVWDDWNHKHRQSGAAVGVVQRWFQILLLDVSPFRYSWVKLQRAACRLLP